MCLKLHLQHWALDIEGQPGGVGEWTTAIENQLNIIHLRPISLNLTTNLEMSMNSCNLQEVYILLAYSSYYNLPLPKATVPDSY